MSITTYRTISRSANSALQVQLNTPSFVESTTIARPTLVFLHFWGGSMRTWSAVIDPLAKTYPTVAISLRGWGGSTGPDEASAYTVIDMAEDVEFVIHTLGLSNTVLVGHSMGGKVAQTVAGRGQVAGLRGLVLVAPAPPTPFRLPEDMRQQQIDAYASRESAEFVVRNVLTSAESALSDGAVRELVADMLAGNEHARRAWPAYGMGEDVSELVKKIAVPVLIVAGAKDAVEQVEAVRNRVIPNIQGAGMVVLEQSGHLIPVERPETLVEVLESYLQGLGKAQ